MRRTIDRKQASLSAILTAALSLCGGLELGCVGSSDLEYRVRAGSAPPLLVEITIHDPPRAGLVLRGHADRHILRIRDVHVRDDRGVDRRVEAGFEQASLGRAILDLPVFRVPGPLPSRITVRYAVDLGVREGDEHQGYRGRRHGLCSPRLTFFTGRQAFLIPDLSDREPRVAVRFDVPDDREVITPWRGRGRAWRPGVGPAHGLDDLLAGTIGIGHFHTHTMNLGRTRFELAYSEGTPADIESRSFEQLTAAARYLHERFRRPLGRTYRVLVLPKTQEGDELIGDGWATGQGGTLLPLTASRLAAFALRLADAYLRDAPYRMTLDDRSEFWLVDGLRQLYAWRSVAAAGLLSSDEVNERVALRYAAEIEAGTMLPDLERLYDEPSTGPGEREILAPYVLDLLDRTLVMRSGGRESLDHAVRAFAARRGGSLYSILASSRSISWQDFRRDQVRGRRPSKLAQGLPPTRPSSGADGVREPRGAKTITLVYTGDTNAYLENCGCKGNQAGGLARRVTLLERLRREHADLFLVDAGNTFSQPDKQPSLDTLAREELRFALGTLSAMRYDAIAVGSTELIYGVPTFHALTEGLGLPYLNASLRDRHGPLVPATRTATRAGVTLGICGLLDPPRGLEVDVRYEDAVADLHQEDPVSSARAWLPRLAHVSDLLVAVGKLSPATIRRLVAAFPDLDIVVSTDDQLPIPETDGDARDRSGFLGSTLVLYTDQTRYGVNLAHLTIAGGRVVTARLEAIRLDAKIADDPDVRNRLTALYERIGRLDAAQGAVRSPFAGDSLRSSGSYVGAAACAQCHAAEFVQWRSTPHATAYKTLLDVHRHYQPRCVSCHVVGFGTATGFHVGSADEHLANVQCEVCHGPGGRHVVQPVRGTIVRNVPATVCLACHTADHSDHFVYRERLPRVLHTLPLALRAAHSGSSIGP